MKSQLEILNNLQELASDEIKKLISQDMRLLQYGELGEENVLFELMNSFIPMLVLRDLQFEYEDLSAQIDFVVITRKLTFIIECKNLFGDIEVNNSGDFIRTLEFGGKKSRKEYTAPSRKTEGILTSLKLTEKKAKEIFSLKCCLKSILMKTTSQ